MRSLAIYFLMALVWPFTAGGQTDTLRLKEPYAEGIFISYDDFRHQRQIQKSAVVTPISKSYLDFYSRVLFEKELVFEENGRQLNLPSAEVWAFFRITPCILISRVSFTGSRCSVRLVIL